MDTVMYVMKDDSQYDTYDTEASHAGRGRETHKLGGQTPLPLHLRSQLVLQEHVTHTIPGGWCVACIHMGLLLIYESGNVTLQCIEVSTMLVAYLLFIPVIM
jgi:hypothetical protein